MPGTAARLVLLAAAALSAGATRHAPRRFTDPFSQVRFVWIPAGRFEMGSALSDAGRQVDESLHAVVLSRGFWLGETEVTQGQWARVTGEHPSRFSSCGADCPVESVSGRDVERFLAIMNRRAGGGYRLPTEAEWEYACRAGQGDGGGRRLSTGLANYDGRYPGVSAEKGIFRGKPVPVRSFPPNGWGLFDMRGNVWEWCRDWYGPYPGAARDPAGPRGGRVKVIRGGSWYFGGDSCRCALRDTHAPEDRGFSLGLRLARSF